MNTTTYPADSIEHLVQQSLNDLITKVKEQLYTKRFKEGPDFNTNETDLETLGAIISKYCEWSGDDIKTVAMAAFEDSNYLRVKINL